MICKDRTGSNSDKNLTARQEYNYETMSDRKERIRRSGIPPDDPEIDLLAKIWAVPKNGTWFALVRWANWLSQVPRAAV